MNKKSIFLPIIMVIVLCLFAETVSFLVIRSQHLQEVGFLFNINYHNEVNTTKGFGFDEIDPLCGWAMSNKTIRSMGYEVEQNCEVLKCKGDQPNIPIRIFISGGSTTDIALHKENWPVELQKLLIADKVNTIIYVGGVGGYSSGQELLKLMRDGLRLNPDIHISYTGANDAEDSSSYVSKYESAFYASAYKESYTSKILPCTVFLIKKRLNLSYYDLRIKESRSMGAFNFWKQNMNVMTAIAQKNKYNFVGILQPVLGMGAYRQGNADSIDQGNYSKGYQNYFPTARDYMQKSGDSSLYDLTGIFDTVKGHVYIDDCHINDAYQAVVASNVYKILLEKGYLSPKQ